MLARGESTNHATSSVMDPVPGAASPLASPGPAAPRLSADERQLVELILQKDRKAAARLVSDHADAIYAYVRHRLAPRADIVEDVVQDVFVAALGSLARFSGMSPLRTWLLGIARHKVEDYYRQQLRAHAPLPDDDEQTTAVAPEPLIDETIDRERLKTRTHRVLRQLPEQYAIALLWRYWENRSVHDMAEATGKTDKAIERLLARARARFRELWGQVP
jgi:RNA polymerase sigma factor (sigma-70 family)